MLITKSAIIFCSNTSHHSLKKNGRKSAGTTAALAKKRDLADENSSNQQPIFPLKLSKGLLAQSAVAVFGLGFIDAGYSGDWSRIGVISEETEDFLKAAAFVFAPLCIFLILSFSEKSQD